MLSALSIANAAGVDVPLLSANRRVRAAPGLAGLPAARASVRPRPDRHGAINETSYLGEDVIAIEMILRRASEAELWSEYDDLLEVLWEAIGNDRLLKWTREGSGLALQQTVRYHDAFDAPLRVEDAGVIMPVLVTFLAEDPRAYAQALTTATGAALSAAAGGLVFPAKFNGASAGGWKFTPSGGGIASFDNTGKVPTPVLVRVFGQCSTPQILLVDTGERIAFTGSIPDGGHLDVDLADRSLLLNGTISRRNLLDSEATDWPEGAPKGVSTWRLLAATFGVSARIDVIGRAARA